MLQLILSTLSSVNRFSSMMWLKADWKKMDAKILLHLSWAVLSFRSFAFLILCCSCRVWKMFYSWYYQKNQRDLSWAFIISLSKIYTITTSSPMLIFLYPLYFAIAILSILPPTKFLSVQSLSSEKDSIPLSLFDFVNSTEAVLSLFSSSPAWLGLSLSWLFLVISKFNFVTAYQLVEERELVYGFMSKMLSSDSCCFICIISYCIC